MAITNTGALALLYLYNMKAPTKLRADKCTISEPFPVLEQPIPALGIDPPPNTMVKFIPDASEGVYGECALYYNRIDAFNIIPEGMIEQYVTEETNPGVQDVGDCFTNRNLTEVAQELINKLGMGAVIQSYDEFGSEFFTPVTLEVSDFDFNKPIPKSNDLLLPSMYVKYVANKRGMAITVDSKWDSYITYGVLPGIIAQNYYPNVKALSVELLSPSVDVDDGFVIRLTMEPTEEVTLIPFDLRTNPESLIHFYISDTHLPPGAYAQQNCVLLSPGISTVDVKFITNHKEHSSYPLQIPILIPKGYDINNLPEPGYFILMQTLVDTNP